MHVTVREGLQVKGPMPVLHGCVHSVHAQCTYGAKRLNCIAIRVCVI